MNTFEFKNSYIQEHRVELINADYNYEDTFEQRRNFAKEIQQSLEFTSLTGDSLPDNVVHHFKNADTDYTAFDNEVVSLSEYNKQFPNNNLLPEHLDHYKKEGSAVEVKDFFGNKETYILAHVLPEYDKLFESKHSDKFDEFLKPFLNASPTLINAMPDVACKKIMDNHIENQPDFLKSTNLGPNFLSDEIYHPTMFFKESELKNHVAALAGSYLAQDVGYNPYDLGLTKAGKEVGNTSTYHEKDLFAYVKNNEDGQYALLLSACKERCPNQESALKVANLIVKEAASQCKNFELQYNEQRREFDKNQPFKNQAFNIVDKLGDKFNQAVQGLKKVWQVVTTKNLAIEQSKEQQKNVQVQKNTPEFKQQIKSKDMER